MPITLIANVGCFGLNTTTSSTIDTTGATLLVVNISGAPSGFPATLSDSKSNMWAALTPAGTSAFSALYYAENPVVGTGHTFTFTTSLGACAMQVQAFAGVKLSSPFDQESGFGGGSTATGQNPGNITASVANMLFVTGYEKEGGTSAVYTITSPFTITDQAPFLGGTNYGGAMAWAISSGLENPFWFDNHGGDVGRNAATMATFFSDDGFESVSDSNSLSDSIGEGRGYLFTETVSFSESISEDVSGSVPSGKEISGSDFISLIDSVTIGFGVQPPPHRGNIDYDQIRVAARAGDGAKFHTLTGSVTTGHGVVFDANGNLVDSGSAPGGTGTVTNTGTLTVNLPVLGNGGVDVKIGTAAQLVPTLPSDATKYLDGTGAFTVPAGGGATYPKRATLWYEEFTVLTGTVGTTWIQSSLIHYAVEAYQTTPANGNETTLSFLAAAGTYSMTILGQTDNNRGKVDWYLDGASILTGDDWYSGSIGSNVIRTTTGISISTDGYHILKATINGKNGSSSNYYLVLTKIWFKQSAD